MCKLTECFTNYLRGLQGRLDFKFHPILAAPVIILLLTIPACMWLPMHYAEENSLIENAQLIIILITFIMCLKAKSDKVFFNAMALVMVILFLREINCGRTVFFPVPWLEDTFYTWGELPYGFLAHPLYGAFMAFSGLYFISSKGYLIFWKYIMKAKVSVYAWVLVILGIIFGLYGEACGVLMLEEMTETLFYTSLMAIIGLQALNTEYIMAADK